MLPPSVCLIGQGRKRLFLREEAYVYDAHRFLITSVDLPVVAQIIEASADRPYLGLTMELDLRVIAQLMLNDERPPGRASKGSFTRRRVARVSSASYSSGPRRTINISDGGWWQVLGRPCNGGW